MLSCCQRRFLRVTQSWPAWGPFYRLRKHDVTPAPSASTPSIKTKGLPRPPEKGSVASCLISVQLSPPAGSLAGGCTSLNAFGSSWPSSQKEKGNWSFENTSLLNGNWFTLPACGWISKFQSNAILFPFSAANSSNLKFHLHFLWT